MPATKKTRRTRGSGRAVGFSLIEMLVSIVIIVLLMGAVFPFLFQAQRRFQGNVVVSEANQSARAALEVMSQEIGQAGYNPQFTLNKTMTASITPNGQPQCVHINPDASGNPGATGINPGDWVSVGMGANQELVEVLSTNHAAGISLQTDGSTPPSCSPTPATDWIEAKFQMCHNNTTSPCNATAASYPVSSYKMPYGGGLLYKSDGSQSNDLRLEFYGDINQTGEIDYVVYSISPMVPATSVTINGTSYRLYNLYRSITPVPFQSIPLPTTFTPSCSSSTSGCNSQASPMVEKVLFNATSATTGTGPTGLPIFSYPNTVVVGVIPNQITVVGTIVITLCVAVNPQAMESGQVQWYSMATQIRPLNLAAAINVNHSNGGTYMPPTPRTLPMAYPTSPPYYP
jgi:prepilin-type N-terminal cleavage/methylation domain-containing protein